MDVQRQRGLRSFVELLAEKDKDKETTIIHLVSDAIFRLEPVKEFSEYPQLKVDKTI